MTYPKVLHINVKTQHKSSANSTVVGASKSRSFRRALNIAKDVADTMMAGSAFSVLTREARSTSSLPGINNTIPKSAYNKSRRT